ncbi:MAG: SMC-Scp complex subunit ScpB [Cyanobacteriota bacterium]
MSLKARVEATLFTTGKALTIEEISEIVKAPNEDLEEALLELIMDYSSRDGALEIDDEDGYVIQVKEEYFDIVESLMPIEMSENALKTLSAIAIKQPVLQSDLVNIIGMGVYDHINYLLGKELISKKPKGKSFMIKTTTKFNEYFKLTGDTKTLAQILDIQSKN